MKLPEIATELERNRKLFEVWLRNRNKQEVLWKPTPEKWNLLEIVCHLYDEEREDFRFRAQWILENPQKTMPMFDPAAWVVERKYSEQHFDEKLQAFLEEREKNSIPFVKSLKETDLQESYDHPKKGSLSVLFFLNNWVAHDRLHLRQILRLLFAQHQQQGLPLDYAGNW